MNITEKFILVTMLVSMLQAHGYKHTVNKPIVYNLFVYNRLMMVHGHCPIVASCLKTYIYTESVRKIINL